MIHIMPILGCIFSQGHLNQHVGKNLENHVQAGRRICLLLSSLDKECSAGGEGEADEGEEYAEHLDNAYPSSCLHNVNLVGKTIYYFVVVLPGFRSTDGQSWGYIVLCRTQILRL